MQNYKWSEQDFTMNPSDSWVDYSWIDPQVRKIYGLQKSQKQLGIQCDLCQCSCNNVYRKTLLKIDSKTIMCKHQQCDRQILPDESTFRTLETQNSKLFKRMAYDKQLLNEQEHSNKSEDDCESDYEEVQKDIFLQCRKAIIDLSNKKIELQKSEIISQNKTEQLINRVKTQLTNFDLDQILTICKQYSNSSYFHKSKKMQVISFFQSLTKIRSEYNFDCKQLDNNQGSNRQAVRIWQLIEDNEERGKQIIAKFRDSKTFNKKPRDQFLKITKSLAQQVKTLFSLQ